MIIEVSKLNDHEVARACRCIFPHPWLLLVEALANRWGVSSGPVPRKTVWAEVTLVPAGPPVLPSPLGQAKTSATEPFRGPGHISRTT